MKRVDTEYKGYLFRSRLEARWAIFFDACGVDWEYEPEGYDLGEGLCYVPTFLLHGVDGRCGGDLFVDVKERMTDLDALKINRFASMGMTPDGEYGKSSTAVLVVGRLPEGECAQDITNDICNRAYDHGGPGFPCEFNFETIDGDHFAAHPGINKKGRFELFGDDCNYLCHQDDEATEKAYRRARQARFEPVTGRVRHA